MIKNIVCFFETVVFSPRHSESMVRPAHQPLSLCSRLIKNAVIVVALLPIAVVQAQKPSGVVAETVSPVVQRLFEDALEGCFVVLQRDYQLEDSAGARYGWNGAAAFNSIFSLGVITERGIIVDSNFVTPWVHDVEYEKYNSYKPVATSAFYHNIDEDDEVELVVDEELLCKLEGGMCCSPLSKMMEKKFPVDSISGPAHGVLVLLYGDGKLDSNAIRKPELYFIKKDIKITPLSSIYPIEETLPRSKQILGGIFVRTQIGLGVINMSVVGVMQQQDGKWQVVIPFKEKARNIDTGNLDLDNLNLFKKNNITNEGLTPTEGNTKLE